MILFSPYHPLYRYGPTPPKSGGFSASCKTGHFWTKSQGALLHYSILTSPPVFSSTHVFFREFCNGTCFFFILDSGLGSLISTSESEVLCVPFTPCDIMYNRRYEVALSNSSSPYVSLFIPLQCIFSQFQSQILIIIKFLNSSSLFPICLLVYLPTEIRYNRCICQDQRK